MALISVQSVNVKCLIRGCETTIVLNTVDEVMRSGLNLDWAPAEQHYIQAHLEGYRPYKCGVCPHSTLLKGLMKKHMVEHHSDTKENYIIDHVENNEDKIKSYVETIRANMISAFSEMPQPSLDRDQSPPRGEAVAIPMKAKRIKKELPDYNEDNKDTTMFDDLMNSTNQEDDTNESMAMMPMKTKRIKKELPDYNEDDDDATMFDELMNITNQEEDNDEEPMVNSMPDKNFKAPEMFQVKQEIPIRRSEMDPMPDYEEEDETMNGLEELEEEQETQGSASIRKSTSRRRKSAYNEQKTRCELCKERRNQVVMINLTTQNYHAEKHAVEENEISRFKCDYPRCNWKSKGDEHKKAALSHLLEKHGKASKTYIKTIPRDSTIVSAWKQKCFPKK